MIDPYLKISILEIAIALEKLKAIRDKKKYNQIKLKAYRRIF